MDFAQMGKLMELAKQIDIEKVTALSKKVDLGELIGAVSKMSAGQLAQMSKMLGGGGSSGDGSPLPPIDGDFYDIASLLTEEQRQIQRRVRTFMEENVQPIINDYWLRDAFPHELIGRFKELDLIRAIFNEDGSRTPQASVLEGIVTMEMSRVDVSMATFFGVHAGLALWSIVLGGDERQRREFVPAMLDMDIIGAFGLTEPKVGSGVAGGLRTTCRRDGDAWVLNGEKKWIGNATFSDFTVIWARDEADGEVRGFIVRKGTPGYHVEKIEGKIALRVVQNGHITLTDCRVPESDRLQAVEGWRTVAHILRQTRAGVAWQGVGCAMGAYELSQQYARERRQFGRPIGSFQLIQNKLVLMLGNVTAMQQMGMRLSQMQDQGIMRDEHASLAKVFCAARCRETVALARDLFGGNGILLEHHVARLFCDAEAIYSYEGSNEINTMVVGRAVTGESAFV
ncbi:MAG: acyl-CoA dehydrogenase family protein [Bacteroidota bacterium]